MIDRTHWVYRNLDNEISINNVPVYFEKIIEEGDKDKGYASFQSYNQYDEVWGSDVKLDVSWEKTDRATYLHGKKVRSTIELYNSIEVVVLKKDTEWVRSHEMTYWYGSRKQILKKRFYATTIIHSVMLCEQTSRVIESHAVIISSLMPNYENLVLDMMRSIQCHEI